MRKFFAVLAVPLQAGEIPGNVSARSMRSIDNGFDSMHFLHVQAASHHGKARRCGPLICWNKTADEHANHARSHHCYAENNHLWACLHPGKLFTGNWIAEPGAVVGHPCQPSPRSWQYKGRARAPRDQPGRCNIDFGPGTLIFSVFAAARRHKHGWYHCPPQKPYSHVSQPQNP